MSEQPTAEPCARCSTTAGLIPDGHIRPWRGRGLCRACYQHLYKRDQQALGTFDTTGWLEPHPRPLPAGLAPILRPDPAQPVWTGLAIAKYPATTWHTYRPRGRRLGEAA